MYSREPKQNTKKSVIRMDPDCAVCRGPASLACDCEAKGLDSAIRHAETRMMESVYSDIRGWVRAHAQDYILEYFRLLTDRRKASHAAHLDRLTAHAYHYYHAPPHPNEIAQAQAALKRGIDEDWQQSVQRYPEVLEYFYSLVELTLPGDDDSSVKDPPLSAMNGSRKATRRNSGLPEPFADPPPPPRPALPARTPPPESRSSRRNRERALERGLTPAPMNPHPMAPPVERRSRTAFRGVPPHAPPTNYFGHYA